MYITTLLTLSEKNIPEINEILIHVYVLLDTLTEEQDMNTKEHSDKTVKIENLLVQANASEIMK